MVHGRNAAYRRLAITYNLVSGLMLTGLVAVAFAFHVDGRSFAAWLVPVIVLLAGSMVVVNIGCWYRQSYAAWAAIAQSAAWMILVLVSEIAISARTGPARHSASGPFELLPFVLQGVVIFFAWRARNSVDDTASSAVAWPVDDAVMAVLGLAANANGRVSPAKLATAMAACQARGMQFHPQQLENRLLSFGNVLSVESVLGHVRGPLNQCMTTVQRQWLFDRAKDVALADGAIEPLGEEFLRQLEETLALAHSRRELVREPFGGPA